MRFRFEVRDLVVEAPSMDDAVRLVAVYFADMAAGCMNDLPQPGAEVSIDCLDPPPGRCERKREHEPHH